MLEKSKCCCEQHIDLAFDDFLVEFETFPNMEDAEELLCDYCEKPAKYILKVD